jgi:hypothetical protein
MKNEIPGVRPAVLSAETGKILDDLRRFRHVARNVYVHHLDPERLGKLVQRALEMLAQLTAEMSAFIVFLEQE